MMKKKKVKVIYKEDDGHTIYDMSGVGNRYGGSSAKNNKTTQNGGVNLTKKERRAVVIAGLKFYLPYLLIMLAGFTVATLLVYLWIS